MKSNKKFDPRLAALRRFAVTITLFNVLGHLWFGFEQSWAHPLVALLTAYALSILLEYVDARVNSREPKFVGGFMPMVNFLLSAHIGALAISMLIYPNQRLLPVVFATAFAICSKYIFRVTVKGRSCHYFNPSNFGIAATLFLFPAVAISPPYMFTENLYGIGDWILPALIVVFGSFLNHRFTRKMPLVLAWVGGFTVQALVRSLIFDVSPYSALLPMTGVAFLLFTFYMITDPATTPWGVRGQVYFGLATAATYGLLVSLHIVFGLFFALTFVCAVRGVALYARSWSTEGQFGKAPVPSTQPASETIGRTR